MTEKINRMIQIVNKEIDHIRYEKEMKQKKYNGYTKLDILVYVFSKCGFTDINDITEHMKRENFTDDTNGAMETYYEFYDIIS